MKAWDSDCSTCRGLVLYGDPFLTPDPYPTPLYLPVIPTLSLMAAAHVEDASTSSTTSPAATVVGSPQTSTFVNGPPKPAEVPLVIPPVHDARTLVLCFDGTGDQSVTVTLNPNQLISLALRFDSDVSANTIQYFLSLTRCCTEFQHCRILYIAQEG